MSGSGEHENGLAEIRALDQELLRGAEEALNQARRIREVQRQASAARGLPATDPVAFVHIPKTAGTTITSMFARAYSRDRLHDAGNIFRGGPKTEGNLVQPRVQYAQVTIGHASYGLFRKHLPSGTRYVTFLRDPVDRVLSHYYRHIHRRSSRTEERRPVTARSLEEAILEKRLPHVTNLATRFLRSDPWPFEDLPASALDEAKANIRRFAFVGITERSDESIALMQRALGMDLVPYGEHRRVTGSGKRPKVGDLTDEQRAMVVEANRLDIELYEFAKTLFEDRVSAAGERLTADLEALRDLNDVAIEEDKAALEAACEWLEQELPPGTTKSHVAMREAAAAAGLSELAFPLANRLVGVQVEIDEKAGERVWTRPERPSRPRAPAPAP